MANPGTLADQIRADRGARVDTLLQRGAVPGEQEVQAAVQEIQKAREEVEQAVQRLTAASDRLRTHVRRFRDPSSTSYTMYANSHIRLAGALNQGMKRAGSMDRMLDRAASEREVVAEREQQRRLEEERRASQRELEQSLLPTNDDFAEVYGDVTEEQNDA